LLGEAATLPPPVPFRDFVMQARLGVEAAEHEAFFGRMLHDVSEPTMPFGLVDVQGDGSRIVEARRPLDAALGLRLRAAARAAGVSVASLCHLAWAMVLARASGRDDVVFGTVLFGRLQGGEGADRALGMFINMLPVRLDVAAGNARTSVRRAHALLSELLRHEHAPLSLAQRCSAIRAPAPLFTSMLNFRHSAAEVPDAEATARTERAWQGIELLDVQERTNYPFSLFVDDLVDSFVLTAQVDATCDPQLVCGLMHAALESLAAALERDDGTPVARLEVLPAAERERVLDTFNDTALAYPREACLHELFEAQAERTPEAVALRHGARSMTYAQLNANANRLARRLRALGVAPDARVALCVERGPEMVEAMLAVLKAGGAYVPLDPTYPTERLERMLADSAPAVVLVHGAGTALASGPVARLDLVRDASSWAGEDAGNLERAMLRAEHLAYVIYTSGSTGMPKGVAIEHRNAVNFVSWATEAFKAEELASTLFATSINFDLAVYECFAPLACGGTVEIVANALALLDEPREVGLINTVPSAMAALVKAGAVPGSARIVNLAGEALKRELVEAIFATTAIERVCNLYGPTETTTYSTWTAMRRDDGFVAHIGRPLANTQVYILDARGEPVPVGAVGEIFIAGDGVARGYLHRPELTAERFTADPFRAGGRMYRTGDLGRWQADGTIVYLGRNDFQVKVRGFRIELGEIEARLATHEAVGECAVLAREDVAGDKRLVAYVVPAAGRAFDAEALRAHVAATLPEYMVPAAFVALERMPLTLNGKLDRKALPAPAAEAYATREFVEPAPGIETTLAQLWAEVLNVARVGRH
ncbi:MAG TPA: amino acid adenylation domain-containing protein, partial [Burkholderiaceae bacterium]